MQANYLVRAMLVTGCSAQADRSAVVPVSNHLAAIVKRELGGSMTTLRRLTGGAVQETWSFDVETAAGCMGLVLRRSPGVVLDEMFPAAGMEAEAIVIGAVAKQGVPVPAVAYILRPEDGLGEGFIASRVVGEALGKRVVTDPAFATIRQRLASDLANIMARIHQTPIEALPLETLTPADSVRRLEQMLRSSDEPRPVFEAALAWLWRHCPDPTSARLVHGDFRTGNYLLEAHGVTAVLDWEACHFGDPMEDLGWLCMPIWRFGRLDLAAGGVGTRAQLFAAYAEATGLPVDAARVRFWEVRGILYWGLTCVFMAGSVLRGEGHFEWAAVGRRTCETEIELLHAITDGGCDV